MLPGPYANSSGEMVQLSSLEGVIFTPVDGSNRSKVCISHRGFDGQGPNDTWTKPSNLTVGLDGVQ